MMKRAMVFVTFSSLDLDGRTINLARIANQEFLVTIVCLPSQEEITTQLKSEGIEVKEVQLKRRGRVFGRWLEFIRRARKILLVSNCSLVIAEDFFSLPVALRVKKNHGAFVLYDSREIYSAVGSLHSSRIRQFVITLLERFWVAKVNRIIVTGQLDAELLRTHFKLPYLPEVVMNLPPYSNPPRNRSLRERFAIDDNQAIIVYQGMISEGRGLSHMIRALVSLPNVQFCLIGDGTVRGSLNSLARKLGVETRLHFLAPVPYDQLLHYTAGADLGLCIIEPISRSYELALPHKLFEYCMARIPTLATDLPAMKSVIEAEGIGKVIGRELNVDEIVSSIKEMLEMTKHKEMVKNCDSAAGRYSQERQRHIVLDIFHRVDLGLTADSSQ